MSFDQERRKMDNMMLQQLRPPTWHWLRWTALAICLLINGLAVKLLPVYGIVGGPLAGMLTYAMLLAGYRWLRGGEGFHVWRFWTTGAVLLTNVVVSWAIQLYPHGGDLVAHVAN